MPNDPQKAKQTIMGLAKAAKVKAALQKELAAKRAARRNSPAPDPAEDSNAQAMVRRYCEWEPYPGLWCPKFSSYSDYSGSFVERANAEYFMEEYPDLFDQGYGGYNTVWTGIPHDNLANNLPEDVYEKLEGDLSGLEDYPLVDEERHSRMEYEAKAKYWEEDGRNDLRKELIENAGDDVLAHLAAVYADDETLDGWAEDRDEHMNIEEGANVYCNIERLAMGIPNEQLSTWAEMQPQLKDVEQRALMAHLPQFLEIVRQNLGEEMAQKFDRLSDDHLFALFKHLEEKGDGGLWELDNDRQDDPIKNLSLNEWNIKQALLHDFQETHISATEPESPAQMKLPLTAK